MATTHPVDRPFLIIVIILLLSGFLIFLSASYGLLTKGGADFEKVIAIQFLFGIIFGSIFAYIFSRINLFYFRRLSFIFFVIASILCLSVFIPGIGHTHGGATRWIDVGITTFQPSEVLKIAYVLYFSALLAGARKRIYTFKGSILPFLVATGVVAVILMLQKDTGTFGVIACSGVAILFAAGTRFRHLLILIPIGILFLGLLILARPYVKDRIMTYIDPSRDTQGSSYQINQSIIAIGSGEIFGRGFGKSLQKFRYLPEPMGDSIFAVASEEFGFIGSLFLVGMFVALAFRGLHIAIRAPDPFSRLIVVGIVILFVGQSFLNIGAMTGILPLTGIPLIFISKGGTSLLFALIGTGIILNVSRHIKKT